MPLLILSVNKITGHLRQLYSKLRKRPPWTDLNLTEGHGDRSALDAFFKKINLPEKKILTNVILLI